MKTITDPALLKEYTARFPLRELFSFDISPFISVVQYESEESMMAEGSPLENLLFLIEGRAKLFITHSNGSVSLIDFFDPGNFMGEMELIGAQKFTNGITAVKPCTCYAIRADRCREKLLNDPRFLRNLCLTMSRRSIQESVAFSKSLAYPLKNRLAHFILLTARHGIYCEKHTETAEYLGVTYRHLLYVLAEFVKEGILKKTENGYQIEDMKTLQKLSEFI